jgi:signal transduction histidine kinase
MKWPRTLASRLALIFFTGLVLAYGLSFSLQAYERYISSRSMMLSNLEQDVATSVAILDRLPAAERAAWLPRLERRTYRYRLDQGLPGQAMPSSEPPMAAESIVKAIGDRYPLTFQDIPGPNAHFQAHLRLADGAPLTIDVTPSPVPVARWLPLVLLIQLAVLLFCTWLAVRLAIGPLLAAISHDLQTPITRMKLRVEVMDEGVEKDKLWHDLDAMEHLVREGVAYARSMDINTEPPCRINLDAFLDSLVFDYQDSGAQVERQGSTDSLLETRPHALRRVLVNLVDNALKFAGKAQLEVSREQGHTVIRVLDDGPGIPAEELGEVLKPFYRVESSRNRSTGGTGLGLAIAHQLIQAMGGRLTLSNRQSGGLCAQIEL